MGTPIVSGSSCPVGFTKLTLYNGYYHRQLIGSNYPPQTGVDYNVGRHWTELLAQCVVVHWEDGTMDFYTR